MMSISTSSLGMVAAPANSTVNMAAQSTSSALCPPAGMMSHAPAGQTYHNVEHAGECTLAENAGGYPNTNRSFMIPPMFKAKYSEPIDESTGAVLKTNRNLTKKEQNRFLGTTRNAIGEEAEYAAFKVFEQLLQSRSNPPLLVIRNFELTIDPKQSFRTSVLTSELGINFQGIRTLGELDALILIKDTGLLLVEVKCQWTVEQEGKAEDQLQKGKLFFERIMSHIAGPACRFPIVKIIMFPGELSPSPVSKTTHDTHIINNDFEKWIEVMVELNALKSNIGFSSLDFQRFVYIVTGVWCMEPYQNGSYRYNKDNASQALLLQQNDKMVDCAMLTSDVRTAKDESKIVTPVANVELCRPEDGFPKCAGLNLIYLTPDQKNIYQAVPQAVLRGVAGSGKTILFQLKITDILKNHNNKNVLIIAPEPHHLRMEQFVTLNGAQATVSETFPPHVHGGVIIMTLKNFFDVSPPTLASYNIADFHLFIDDLQSLHFYDSKTEFKDVVRFIERTYAILKGTDKTFWCAVDEGQSEYADVNNSDVTSLFNTDKTTPRQLTVPVYILDKVLRNSVEISTVVKKARDMRIKEKNASSVILGKQTTGHRIRSQTVSYHKLTKWTGSKGIYSEDWKKHGIAFAVDRVQEELLLLLASPNTMMNLNDIAILYDRDNGVARALTDMMLITFNTIPQTIEGYITTNNNSFIMDEYDNAASFECACVLYVCGRTSPSYCDNYNIMTRARSKLVVVDFDADQDPPFLTDNIVMTLWEERKT